MTKIITFDFDGTLTRPEIQSYFQAMRENYDVWILTSRYDELHKHLYPNNPTNEDLYEVLEELDFPKSKVIFTNMKPKAEYLIGTNVAYHLDDDEIELEQIDKECNTIGIKVSDDCWISSNL